MIEVSARGAKRESAASKWSAAMRCSVPPIRDVGRGLLEAAMTAEKNMGIRRQVRPPQMKNTPATVAKTPSDANVEDHAILVEYRDGLQAAVFKMGSSSDRWNFACRLKGESQPRAMSIFNGPWGNRCMFKALSHAIQYLFVEQPQPYPIERTLLTTGATEAAMHRTAWANRSTRRNLEIAYQAVDFKAFRESGRQLEIDHRRDATDDV